MLSRALSIATVTLLIACLPAGAVRAQNLDAGKSPSQIFSSTCSACHKSPRGLLKNTPASSLPGFLRQHYTTGTDMASVLSSYLISNGAADPRYQSKDQSKRDARRNARQDPREDARQDPRQDARPEQSERYSRRRPAAAQDADAARPQSERARPGRDAKRYGRPRVAPDAADGQAPVQAATDSKPPGRQKQGRRGRPAAVPDEPPRTEQVAPGNTTKEDETSRDVSRSESAATESAKPAAAKSDSDSVRSDPSSTDAIGSGIREMRPESSKVEAIKDISEPNPLRPDPVTSVAADPPGAPATTSAAPVTAGPAGPPAPPISR
ncbi:hypothetical protein [Bradyrhizobium roseum]|uniref:hypothetical protein n=1 Tax=Bradyrhizobium roseum TaxID=3056648 RepID=UPI002617006E|nr:hypothetical protein [Bradyrhizobium roseus]WKA25945.1 hypothetical protein QUH67_20205 [Bradyrhizobium roseus]